MARILKTIHLTQGEGFPNYIITVTEDEILYTQDPKSNRWSLATVSLLKVDTPFKENEINHRIMPKTVDEKMDYVQEVLSRRARNARMEELERDNKWLTEFKLLVEEENKRFAEENKLLMEEENKRFTDFRLLMEEENKRLTEENKRLMEKAADKLGEMKVIETSWPMPRRCPLMLDKTTEDELTDWYQKQILRNQLTVEKSMVRRCMETIQDKDRLIDELRRKLKL